MKQPPFIQWIDKMTFVFGVCLLVLTQYLILRYPQYFHYAYTLLIVPVRQKRFLKEITDLIVVVCM